VGIELDYRTGSKELAPLFTPYGIQVKVTRLEFGDLAFEGNGPWGRCGVVIERKRIQDLMASIQSRRLSGHQLPGMADAYDYCYLIVEGLWRAAEDGAVEVGHGSMTGEHFGGRWTSGRGRGMHYRAVDNYLTTLELHAGVIVRRSLTAVETVCQVVDLYRWWNEKEWGEHSAHVGVYAPAMVAQGKGRLNLAHRVAGLTEKMAMQLPGLDKKAQLAAERFRTPRAMVNSTADEWQEVKGIGKLTARKIVEALNGGS
jgi:ERCC4-type nuclease